MCVCGGGGGEREKRGEGNGRKRGGGGGGAGGTLRAPLSGTFLQTLPDEGVLLISAQLSTDAVSAVSALRKVRVLVRLWKQPSAQART